MKHFFLFAGLFVCMASMRAQVTIGSVQAPEKGALLQIKEHEADVNNTTATHGLSLPRVKLTDMANLYPMFEDNGSGGYKIGTTDYIKQDEDAIHTGLTVYNVSTCTVGSYGPGIYTWDGGMWRYMHQGGSVINIPGLSNVSGPGSIYDCKATLTATTDAGMRIDWYDAATGGTKLATGNSFTTPVLSQAQTFYVEAVDPVSECGSQRIPFVVDVEAPYINNFNRTSYDFSTNLGVGLSITFNVNADWQYTATGNFANVVTSPSQAQGTTKTTGAGPFNGASDTFSFTSSSDYSAEWNTRYSTTLTFSTQTACGTPASQDVTLTRTVPQVLNPTYVSPANGSTVSYQAFNVQVNANSNGAWAGIGRLNINNGGTQLAGVWATRGSGWNAASTYFTIPENLGAQRTIQVGVHNAVGAVQHVANITQQAFPGITCGNSRFIFGSGTYSQAVAACASYGSGWSMFAMGTSIYDTSGCLPSRYNIWVSGSYGNYLNDNNSGSYVQGYPIGNFPRDRLSKGTERKGAIASSVRGYVCMKRYK